MLFFRSYFFKGSETDLNKLVQKQLALNSTITTLESFQEDLTTNLLLKLVKNMHFLTFHTTTQGTRWHWKIFSSVVLFSFI